MARQSEFVEFVLEQLAAIGGARARAMFGGYGIYQGDIMFAIVVDDRLYFKTDDTTRKKFTARGLNPFTYVSCGKTIAIQYYEVPPEVFEESRAMQRWAQQAVAAALHTKRDRKLSGKRKSRSKKSRP